MSTAERDPHTGHMTTGHEWNGITELNTRVPRAVYVFLIATALFAIGYWILMPSFPLGTTYAKGMLGVDQRTTVTDTMKEAALDRATWEIRIANQSFEQIQGNSQLMAVVRQSGHTLFGDNCAACHGREAQGQTGGRHGFPNLTTASWLWGGTPDKIAETIRVGVNSSHSDSRVSQMLAFGRDGMLPRGDIENVVAYVRSLSMPVDAALEQIAAGKEVFAKTCVSCHGEKATGNPELGGPNLADTFWIYGGDNARVFATVWGGRQGHMPTWEARLSPVERKILALYLVDLRKPDQ